MRVIYHPEAEAETITAARFYESRRAGLGGEFLDEVDGAVTRLAEDPCRLPVIDDPVRRQPVRRFPYDLYFRVVHGEVRVLAVAHHGRTTGYWKSRR